ncbi:MAG TPA: glycosyltransferase family 1 protein, partial [Mycobacteriales bacterium]|nr:glycosyltransferase family 1 protein [Mycobacteriales bacterium]
TPVVASDLPALREVGRSHVRFAPVGDAEAFAAQLHAALEAPGDAEPGRAHARTFTWDRCAELTRAVYAQSAR